MPLAFTLSRSNKKVGLVGKSLSLSLCTNFTAESPIIACGSQSKFREIENRCVCAGGEEQHLAVINIIPKVVSRTTDPQSDRPTDRATAKRDSNPRFGSGREQRTVANTLDAHALFKGGEPGSGGGGTLW